MEIIIVYLKRLWIVIKFGTVSFSLMNCGVTKDLNPRYVAYQLNSFKSLYPDRSKTTIDNHKALDS